MKPKLIAILVANAFAAWPLAVGAEGGLTWSGEASLGLRYTNDNAADSSKLNEYRDLDSGVTSALDVRGRGDAYYFNFYGENPGFDDQYFDLRGGKYGWFKYRLYDSELRHNFGSGPGARSPYSGIGTPVLTATFPSLNPATWNGFDHSYERRDMGAMAELSFDSPWYVRFDGNQVKRKGINVLAGAQGTSPGNGFVDLPAPVDFKTNNASVEAGYQGQTSHVAMSGMYSKFSNDNELLRWSNGFFSPANPLNRDTTVLAPENELLRLSANGNIRKLPGNSTLAGRVTWSKLTNDVPILPTMLSTGSTNPATGSSSPVFNGEIKRTTLGLSFSSHPLAQLDTRFYYNYAKEDNNSTHLTFTSAALGCAASCVPEPFEYKKHNLGFEAGYRINRQNRLTGGFDYYDVKRERIDFTDSEDKKFFIEWKNSSLDVLTARIKYQYLDRDSTYVLTPTSPLVVANPTEFYVRRFDVANVEQNMIKLVLDASPIPFVDLGFEAIYKKNDYKDTALGRTEDERQEYYASVSFGDPKKFRIMVFGDIELLQIDSRHRVGGTTLANSNPAAPPSGASALGNTIYTWDAKNEDKAWQVGVGADWLPMERLRLNASLIYAKTEGTTDFAAQAGTLVTVPFLPINNFDNTKRTALNLKGTYKLDRNWSMTAGYAYERYKYSDIGYDGFRYVAGTGATASYMTGQYAFQPYSANIFYVVGTYKF